MSQFLLATILLFSNADGAAKTVENNIKPEKSYTLKLEEDLRVLDKGRENFLWVGETVSVDVDDKGNMYVADPEGDRIIVINPEGDFLKQIGGKGEGPGEFEHLRWFKFLSDGSAIAFEQLQFFAAMNSYDANLKFQKRNILREGFALASLSASPTGNQYASSIVYFTEEDHNGKQSMQISEFVILDKDFKKKHSVIKHELEPSTAFDLETENGWVQFLSSRYKTRYTGGTAHITFDDQDNIYTALGRPYEITKWSPNLKKQLVFTKKYKPISLSTAEREAMAEEMREGLFSQFGKHRHAIFTKAFVEKVFEAAELPFRKIPIHGLTFFKGKILVKHNQNFLNNEVLVDIFSTDGVYLGNYRQPNNGLDKMVFKNGYAYTIETSEGEKQLVRYKASFVPGKASGSPGQ